MVLKYTNTRVREKYFNVVNFYEPSLLNYFYTFFSCNIL